MAAAWRREHSGNGFALFVVIDRSSLTTACLPACAWVGSHGLYQYIRLDCYLTCPIEEVYLLSNVSGNKINSSTAEPVPLVQR